MLRALAVFSFLLCAAPLAAAQPREGYITTPDSVRLFYRVVGSAGTKLVVVHGGPGNSHMSVAPDFTRFEELYTVIYYDQRGNGGSDVITDPGRLGLDQHVADLEAVRRHFGLERMNLIGNSWGGLLVAVYASAHPNRVERLILDSPAPPTIQYLAQAGESLTNRFRRRYSGEELRRLEVMFDPELHAAAENQLEMCRDWSRMLIPMMMLDGSAYPRFRGDLCFGSEDALRQQQRVNKAAWDSMGEFDLRARARSITAATLVIHGVGDNIPLAGSQAWAAAIPNAHLLVIEGAGHIAQVERPDVFFPAIEQFLAGQWPAGTIPPR